MSEYQYYEWQAFDRPLNDAQVSEVEALSSHMDHVSSTMASVSYSYGDFKHDPIKVLAGFFDAHLYSANWGTRHLAFRFPKALINTDALDPYLIDDAVELSTHGQYVILELNYDPEDGGDTDWVDDESVLGRMGSVRQQIMAGDYRALYLMWLSHVQRHPSGDDADDADDADDEDDEDDQDVGYDRDDQDEKRVEPPVPPGLNKLDGGLAALCDLFGIDRHLVKAAAARSAKISVPTEAELRTAIARLPRVRADAYLLGLLNDEPQLAHQLHAELGLGKTTPSSQNRRAAQALLADAKQEASAADKRDRAAKEKARLQHLENLATRESSAWDEISRLLPQKLASTYDAATTLLVDLQALAVHRGSQTDFRQHLAQIYNRFGKSAAFVRRLKVAGLL